MGSYDYGKIEIVNYVYQNFAPGSSCLDVGACDGEYFNLLGDLLTMDAVEVWEPNIERFDLKSKYRMIYHNDIRGLKYGDYDVIIFGDVIEHMTVDEARECIEYAKSHSSMVIVAVPYRFKQDAIYGNPYEVHIQDDLTEDLFMQRYEGFKCEIPYYNYGYFVWRKQV